jgi:uncharacterized protein DUF4384
MKRRWWFGGLAWLALAGTPAAARADLGVELWTDRGNDAVYRPGERMDVQARASEDAYLLVYEIDAEGYVRMLFPYEGSSGFVEGRRTYQLPPDDAQLELVVQEPVGQGYIVALASRERFRELPWYLLPYDAQAEDVGYEGEMRDEEGVTAEGRIVGDPFVAMERIRRRVLENYDYQEDFASAYVTYYVHHAVRYPRYLCYDCHRPNQWAWWDGFDPYYTQCSVFDFRVNWSWGWGPGYWSGFVPYYYYVYRYDCPPRYRTYYASHTCYSSWDGWRRWQSLWGGRLTRYKSPPPAGDVPPVRYRDQRSGGKAPPGFMLSDARRGRDDMRLKLPRGRNAPDRGWSSGGKGGLQAPRRKDVMREPLREPRLLGQRGELIQRRDRGSETRLPVREWKGSIEGPPLRADRTLRGRMERSRPQSDPWQERLIRGRMERQGQHEGSAALRREPPRFERPDLKRYEHREPPRIERREPPRFERHEPPRIERSASPRIERREPPRIERFEPPRESRPAPAPRIERRDEGGQRGTQPAWKGGKGR